MTDCMMFLTFFNNLLCAASNRIALHCIVLCCIACLMHGE